MPSTSEENMVEATEILSNAASIFEGKTDEINQALTDFSDEIDLADEGVAGILNYAQNSEGLSNQRNTPEGAILAGEFPVCRHHVSHDSVVTKTANGVAFLSVGGGWYRQFGEDVAIAKLEGKEITISFNPVNVAASVKVLGSAAVNIDAGVNQVTFIAGDVGSDLLYEFQPQTAADTLTIEKIQLNLGNKKGRYVELSEVENENICLRHCVVYGEAKRKIGIIGIVKFIGGFAVGETLSHPKEMYSEPSVAVISHLFKPTLINSTGGIADAVPLALPYDFYIRGQRYWGFRFAGDFTNIDRLLGNYFIEVPEADRIIFTTDL